MKKIAKITVGIALATAFATTAGVLAGCANTPKNGTGEAYGLVHGAGYVGYSKIVYEDDKITDLVLTEVCLPTQVKATESVAADDRVDVSTTTVSGTTTAYYYKTVSYGSVKLTYDVDAKDYKVGSDTFVKYLESEANCKAYYEAVINNQIKVTVGSEQKSDIMTKNKLSKEENGYWTRTNASGSWKTDVTATDSTAYSRWKMNRDATVEYVKENGVGKLKNLTKTADGTDLKEGSAVQYWTDGTVTTGATWSDLNAADKKGKTYYTYAELIIKASDAVK